MKRAIPLYPSVYAVRRRFREEGARAAARHVIARTQAQLIERNCHIVVVTDLHEIAVPVRRGELRVESLERRHLPLLHELNQERHDLTGDMRFAGDLDKRYGGFVAFKDDELVGFYWWTDASMDPHHELRNVALGVELGPGDAYGTDFYVAERHRGGGRASDFLYQIETALRERGFERLWGTVEVNNRAARWTYATRGYADQWTVAGRRLLRRWSYRTEQIDERAGVYR